MKNESVHGPGSIQTVELTGLVTAALKIAEERTLCRSEIPAVLGQLETLKAVLWSKLHQNEPPVTLPHSHDELLDIQEAARRLGMSKDWIYANHDKLPFVVRNGARSLRFSSNGLDQYIRNRRKGT